MLSANLESGIWNVCLDLNNNLKETVLGCDFWEADPCQRSLLLCQLGNCFGNDMYLDLSNVLFNFGVFKIMIL